MQQNILEKLLKNSTDILDWDLSLFMDFIVNNLTKFRDFLHLKTFRYKFYNAITLKQLKIDDFILKHLIKDFMECNNAYFLNEVIFQSFIKIISKFEVLDAINNVK